MILIDEKVMETITDTLYRLSRGRVPCKQVQREAFDCLLTIKKAHPELTRGLLEKSLESIINKEIAPCKQK